MTNVMERVFAENVENVTSTTLQRNARKLSDVQTVLETTRYMQKLAKKWKREKEIMSVK